LKLPEPGLGRIADAAVPAQVLAVLTDLTAALPILLDENLVGIYLYGSLTQGAFNTERSDVDCIVVIQHELTDGQFTQLDHWLTGAAARSPWVARLQISFLVRETILIDTPGGNCLYQFGRLTRVGSDGNPIIWLNVLGSRAVLLGPPAESFVPPITFEILSKALAREVGYLREEVIEKPASEWRDVPTYRAYAVLTLCRILYSHAHGTVVSKPRAAEWALRVLPETWHEVIKQALAGNVDQMSTGIDMPSIARFIEFADTQLRANPEPGRGPF
jgi:hypothetical protein